MKNRKCPHHKNCWDYGSCEDCELGKEITRLHKRIDRLKKQNEKLTVNMNAYGLTAKRLGEENERLHASCTELTQNLHECKADTVRKMQEGVTPIIDELIELMWDDNASKCIVGGCHKPSSIACGNRICIDENKDIWHGKLAQNAKEILEGK